MKMFGIIKSIASKLFSIKAGMLYVLLLSIAIGAATFVENDFGTSAAQKVIYKTKWFELLLVLLCAAVIKNIIDHKFIAQRKWASLLFHFSFLIIVLGAALTRYIGYEGVMHIRENDASSHILSAETYLNFRVGYQNQEYAFDQEVLFASLGKNHFEKQFLFQDDILSIQVDSFTPNPEPQMITTEDGLPTLHLVMGGSTGRENHFIQIGDSKRIQGQLYHAASPVVPQAINFRYDKDQSIQVYFPGVANQMQMASQKQDSIPAHTWVPLLPRSLYTCNGKNFVLSSFNPSAKVAIRSGAAKMKNESVGGVALTMNFKGQNINRVLYGQKGIIGKDQIFDFGELQVMANYGSKVIELPFSVFLRDFQLEKYPGTNSASSYASEVTLQDPNENVEFDYRIFMNNILTYSGFRFFQSSYDQDELGTYLSVNHDFWGTWVSYLGYALLTIGMIWAFFAKNTRMRYLQNQIRKMSQQRKAIVLLLLLLTSSCLFSQNAPAPSQDHGQIVSRWVVQDHRGRLKPYHTLASELMRKIARKTSYGDYSAVQSLLGITLFPDEWTKEPLIKQGSHDLIHSILGTSDKYISYEQFFDQNGRYKLMAEVRKAHATDNVDRGVYEKELLKIDERLNIMSMLLSNSMARIYPLHESPNYLWVTPNERHRTEEGYLDEYFQRFFPAYSQTVSKAIESSNWQLANELAVELRQKQNEIGYAVIPSESKLNGEILLNKSDVFWRLAKSYGILGFFLLILFFYNIFRPLKSDHWMVKGTIWLMYLAFVAHLIGLGLRWYVSGRAPWSNGYESMIYIAFTTALAGILFSRKSTGGLAATSILSSIILLVAHLSYLDPEITPLVPVLKSYWLTIHVSLEAGSYGFLMLGAIIGVINLLLYTIRTSDNRQKINSYVQELTLISELTLTVGLVMISIGTYLGGVWANESWGRYWGWDAKETWALVTILVYAVILHMRFIPGLRGPFAFNVASLFGFASVVMTYFGVNYYLSGLHSYAAGDPVPIPMWVYYTTFSLVVLGVLAYWRFRKSRVNS